MPNGILNVSNQDIEKYLGNVMFLDGEIPYKSQLVGYFNIILLNWFVWYQGPFGIQRIQRIIRNEITSNFKEMKKIQF